MKNKIKEKKNFDINKSQASESISIEIIDLVKVYKQGKIEVVALRGMKETFHPGITIIMGPSGCGKTTLLNLIGGVDKATAGQIIVKGKDITKLENKEFDKYRRENIGFVFQMFNLVPTLSGEENIALPMLLIGKSKIERKERINELLKILNIENRRDHRPEELSGGEQQRFAIAAALANNPDIILCDEPTGELDSKAKKDVLNALENLHKIYPNKIIIIATHDVGSTKIADNVYIIKDGLITEKLKKEQLKEFSKIESKYHTSFEKQKQLNKIKKELDALNKKFREFNLNE